MPPCVRVLVWNSTGVTGTPSALSVLGVLMTRDVRLLQTYLPISTLVILTGTSSLL